MICKKCGAEITENVKFCTNCGTNTEIIEEKQIEQIPSPAPAPQPQMAPKRMYSIKTGKGGGWIVFAKILLWLLFAGIILIGISSGIMLISTGLSSTGSVNVPEEYYYYYGAMRVEPMLAVVSGIAVIIVSIILAFVTVCTGFLAIDACLNLKNMNDNLSELIKISAETGNTSEKINVAVLEIMKKK